MVKGSEVLLERLLADKTTTTISHRATQQFDTVVGLAHVCGQIILGGVVLVASTLPASVAFALVGG